MMILPLADALQNCLQGLTSRIAGLDNEQMSGRAMGMGAMLGYSIGAIKEQFNSPTNNTTTNTKTGRTNNSSGLSSFIDRAKSFINPNFNLSAEKDYDGNTNPIRNVIQTKSNTITTPNSNVNLGKEYSSVNNKKTETIKTSKTTVASNIAKTAYKGTKAYLNIGARMAEGDFSKNTYKPNNNYCKNNFQNTEYINNLANNNNSMQKLGDENELKETR